MSSLRAGGEGLYLNNCPPLPLSLEHEALAFPSILFENLRVTPEEWQNALGLYARASSVPQVKAIEQKFITVRYAKDGKEYTGDYNTLVHMRRVSLAAVLIADRLGYNEADQQLLMEGARVHDAGKLLPEIQAIAGISTLDLEQQALMDSHAEEGLRFAEVTSLGAAVRGMAACHHMYQKRAYGADLPLEGRRIDLEQILAVADALEAMTAIREYRVNDPNRPDQYSIAGAHAKLRDPEKGMRVDKHILDEVSKLLGFNPPLPGTNQPGI